jgi:endonuclease/exonuclease/phosphatase family metal-dependent hydrolase
VRLATWNVLHGRRPDGVVDVPLLGRCCAALGADVLGLQEVHVGSARVGGVDEADEAGRAAGMATSFASVRDERGGGRAGNALLARGAIVDAEVLVLPAWPGRERRCALVAGVALAAGGLLSVAVTHLGLAGEGLDQLPVVLGALAARPPPRALLGDLNLRPPAIATVVEAAGFALAGGGLTFPASAPDRRIDHIAVDGLLVGPVVIPALPLSDHRPLVVEAEPAVSARG